MKRSPKRALKGACAATAYRFACDGDWKAADGILEQAQNSAGDEEKVRIADTRRYLASNRNGLADWRRGRDEEGLRGIGSTDKELANRLEKKGMSRTVCFHLQGQA